MMRKNHVQVRKIIGSLLILFFIASSWTTVGMNIAIKDIQNYNKEDTTYHDFAYVPGTFLLSTTWGQHEFYHEKTPIDSHGNHFRLGCWTVAIGQIMKYHNRQSHGYIEYLYQNQDGDYIPCINDLNDFTYIWINMADKLDGGSTSQQIDHVSQLLFDTGTIIQKNWGHNNYGLSFAEVVNEIESHFKGIAIQTEVVDNPPTSHIIQEIDHHRPIYLYVHNTSIPTGHAVVIDGYEWKGREFWVHLNIGWNGQDNGFYHYLESFGNYDDCSLRRVIFIRLAPILDDIHGPPNGIPGEEYEFSISAQGNHEPLYYKWSWGDGSSTDWMGRYQSNETCLASHTWKEQQNYQIQVKVKDSQGWISPWSNPIEFALPKSTNTLPWIRLIIDRMIQWFPWIESFL